MQHVQEVPSGRVVAGLHLDATAGPREMVPVTEHGAGAGDEPVGDVTRAGLRVRGFLGRLAAERGHAGSQHVHRMGRGGQLLEDGAEPG
jgi:hypothetical protein